MSKLLILLIKCYRILISPIIGPNCRFAPTCSEYMTDAISKYGTIKGLKLGMKRLYRCLPGGGSGFDPLR